MRYGSVEIIFPKKSLEKHSPIFIGEVESSTWSVAGNVQQSCIQLKIMLGRREEVIMGI